MTTSTRTPVAAALTLVDRSLRERFGCKGPHAERWLASTGFEPPAGINRWHESPSGALIARLATSEFLVEGPGLDDASVVDARSRLEQPGRGAGVYPVVRQDLVVELSGLGLVDCLRQVCNVDFRPVIAATDASGGLVILTSMIGVPVVALVRSAGHAPGLVLWIDPSYTHYFWTTMREVAEDCGGASVSARREES